jgi:hypothetical protein
MNNKSIFVLSFGIAVLAGCGTPTDDGPSSVVTQTVTQTVGTRSAPAPTGDPTPQIATGTTVAATTTPPLISTEPLPSFDEPDVTPTLATSPEPTTPTASATP